MRQILIAFLLLVFASAGGGAFAQTVRGTVRAADGEEGLAGVQVLEKGTSNGVLTDTEGRYTLQLQSETPVLVFRFVGFGDQEVAVNGRNEVDITMEEEDFTLDEVVQIGYGTQKRSKLSGAVSTITAEEITEGNILRVEQAIQGRAAGVQVAQNSGSPGSPLTVRVRGIGTIGNADPLYVVDGILVSGLDFLNPADIETISVLKDAAAAAIYGANAANGVVLITTKQGSQGERPRVSYDGYVGTQTPWRQLRLLDAREYAILNNEARIAAGLPPRPGLVDPDALGVGTDWQEELFQNAPISSHNVSVTGGTAKSTYALSGSYFSQEGIIGGEKSGFDRVTVRANFSNDVREWLTVGGRLNFTHLERSTLPENNEFSTPLVRALNIDPVTPIFDPSGQFSPSLFLDTDIFNPINQIDKTNNRYRSDRFLGQVFIEARPFEGFRARSSFATDITHGIFDAFFPEYSLSINDQNLVNSVVKNLDRWRNWQLDNTLDYERTLNDKHLVGVLLGNSIIDNRYENIAANALNLIFNDPRYAYLDNGGTLLEERGSGGGLGESSLVSFFGRLKYEYDGKYLIMTNFRYDGSSKFGPTNRFGFFPSVSAAWVVSEESFMEDLPALTFLKLRGSWGQLGNSNIGDYQFLAAIERGAWGRNGAQGSYAYTFGPNETLVTGSAPTVRANRDIQWETVEQINVGLDAGLWNDKLYFTADYYIKDTKGMLINLPTQGHVGAVDAVVNAATMRNAGWEFSANYRYKVRDFSYSLGGNIGFVDNTLTSLGTGGTPILSGFLQQANGFIAISDVNQPIGAFYGFQTDGIFQTVEEVEAHAFQADGTSPGDFRFVDINNDGVINDEDRTVIGNPTPDFAYGFNGEFVWRGVDVSFFWQGVQGNEIYRGYSRLDFDNVNLPASRLNRWTGPGTSETEPRVVIGDPNQNARVSDYFVEDGSYLRLRNFQIGYTLSEELSRRFKMQKLRVYFSGQNLLTFTEYSGLDPEIGTRGSLEIGIDRGFYPQSRNFVGGVQIGF